ncbi:hypothetical protein CR513_32589, partial [Mucuna pruriens]
MDRSGRPFFPLHWTRQPAISISVDRKDLERWEDAFISELEKLPLLSSTKIIKGTGYSTHSLLELKKNKALLAAQSSGPAEPQENAQASDEGTSRTPSIIGAQEESTKRPRKHPHLSEAVAEEASHPVGDQRGFVLTDCPIDFSALTTTVDQVLASPSLGQEVERLEMTSACRAIQHYTYNLILARAAEKELGLLES